MGAKIIALLGSPLLRGNTAQLLDETIRGAVDAGCDVEKIEVTTLEFRACREIFYCREHEACAMKDDMTGIYDKFRDIDGVIVASPVMTMGIPGRLKSFMDRFQQSTCGESRWSRRRSGSTASACTSGSQA